jgi:hypothetical protein
MKCQKGSFFHPNLKSRTMLCLDVYWGVDSSYHVRTNMSVTWKMKVKVELILKWKFKYGIFGLGHLGVKNYCRLRDTFNTTCELHIDVRSLVEEGVGDMMSIWWLIWHLAWYEIKHNWVQKCKKTVVLDWEGDVRDSEDVDRY